jgi:hypothetical protein
MHYEECEKKGDSHLGDDCHLGLTTFRLPHFCEMLQQQPVNEAIAIIDRLDVLDQNAKLMAQARIRRLHDGMTDRDIPSDIALNVDLPDGNAVILRVYAWVVLC